MPDDRAPETSRAHYWTLCVARLLGLWLAVTAVAFGVRALNRASPAWGSYATQVALAAAAAGGVAAGARRRHREWARPARDLADLAARARAGQAPAEELSAVTGNLAPLAYVVRDLLLDLRAQRVQVAELNDELRQRVARRTETLQRRIGTLTRQATTDPLTGMGNRRQLDESLPLAIDRCRAAGVDLCVLMADVDYFKQLNDARGHAAGDAYLRAIGQLVRSSIRDDDEAFRVGGDEFVIVLPGSSANAGQAMVERLASLAEALGRQHKLPLSPKLSIGMTTLLTAPDPTAPGLVAAADKRLYDAKAARRVKSRAG